MSRVGVKPISLPEKVTVLNNSGNVVVEGPKGKLAFSLPAGISLNSEENKITICRSVEDDRVQRALHGTARAIINNMITGVSKGFEKSLEIQGVGF